MQRCRTQQREVSTPEPRTCSPTTSVPQAAPLSSFSDRDALEVTLSSRVQGLDGTLEVRVEGSGACSFAGTFADEVEGCCDRIEMQFVVTVRDVPVGVPRPAACHASIGPSRYSESDREMVLRFALDEMHELGSLIRQFALRRDTIQYDC